MAVPLARGGESGRYDTEARLLLVRFGFGGAPRSGDTGGGVEHGESHEAAIRRELHEEVGLHDVEVGPAIWTRTHIFPLSSEFGGQRETFYLVRVQRIPGSPALSDQELLAEGLTGSRRWTLAESKIRQWRLLQDVWRTSTSRC